MNQNQQPSNTAATELTEVVCNVLSELAFMVTDDERPEAKPGRVWVQSEITYHGPLSGRLSCWCTHEFATRLAANLLGIESESGEAGQAARDAVGEFLNVLCGQFVTTCFGTHDVFKLSIPVVQVMEGAPPPAEAEAPGVCQLTIEGEPLLVWHQRLG